MIITGVRIFLNTKTPESELRAIAHVVLNDSIILRRIHILEPKEQPNEMKIMYPVYRLQEQGYRRAFYPSSEAGYSKYEQAIISAYYEVKKHPETDTITLVSGEAASKPYEVTASSIYIHTNPESRTLAKVNIELDNEMWFRGMYLMTRDDNSVYLQMPRRRQDNGSQFNLYHPRTQEARDILTNAVMTYYQYQLSQES